MCTKTFCCALSSLHCCTCTLQHTATHCNTLQHTATHYNTLQYTVTHCNTLQHTATHCTPTTATQEFRGESKKLEIGNAKKDVCVCVCVVQSGIKKKERESSFRSLSQSKLGGKQEEQKKGIGEKKIKNCTSCRRLPGKSKTLMCLSTFVGSEEGE